MSSGLALREKRMNVKVMRFLRFSLLFGLIAVLPVEEAHVSEVFYEDSKSTLEDQVKWSQEIVIVEAGKPKTEILRKVVFPKETHHLKRQETAYTESVDVYKVKEVIRSDKLKAGDLIKVFESPDYNEGSIRAYHEEGVSESPIVERYAPVNKAKDTDEKILLLNVHFDKSAKPMLSDGIPVFTFQAEEHVKSKARVLDAIAGKNQKPSHMPDAVLVPDVSSKPKK